MPIFVWKMEIILQKQFPPMNILKKSMSFWQGNIGIVMVWRWWTAMVPWCSSRSAQKNTANMKITSCDCILLLFPLSGWLIFSPIIQGASWLRLEPHIPCSQFTTHVHSITHTDTLNVLNKLQASMKLLWIPLHFCNKLLFLHIFAAPWCKSLTTLMQLSKQHSAANK